MDTKEILKEIKYINKRRKQLEKDLIKSRGYDYWHCSTCGKSTAFHTMNVFQGQWYEQPYGCTGGANWIPSQELYWTCHKCGYVNRMLFHDYGYDSHRRIGVHRHHVFDEFQRQYRESFNNWYMLNSELTEDGSFPSKNNYTMQKHKYVKHYIGKVTKWKGGPKLKLSKEWQDRMEEIIKEAKENGDAGIFNIKPFDLDAYHHIQS